MTVDPVIPPVIPDRPAAPRRRCARHEEREAVGRCTECGGGFCRECLTEHADRLYCGTCFVLKVESARRGAGRKTDWRRCKSAVATAGALLCLVAGFYFLGRMLAAIPAELHDGTVWKETFNP
jgi:ribosomal protein S27AE